MCRECWKLYWAIEDKKAKKNKQTKETKTKKTKTTTSPLKLA